MRLVDYQAELICGFNFGAIEVAQYDDSTYIILEFTIFRLLLEFE